MPFKESDIAQFTTVFGRNLLPEAANFVRPKMLIVTIEDLWPLFRDDLPADATPYTVRSMDRTALEDDLATLTNVASIVGLGGGQAVDAAKYFAWRLNLSSSSSRRRSPSMRSSGIAQACGNTAS